MSSRKSKKNQKLGSSRRNKNRNKDIEENEYDDGFPDPGNEKQDSEHSQFSTVSKQQESNEPAQFDSDQPVIASTSKTPSELSPHPQSYESKNLTGQAEVTSKKRKMGSTRKSNRELKFGGIYEDEPELGGQLCVEVIKEQGETVDVSITEDSGKEDQISLSDCAPSQCAEHESSILQGEDLAHGTTMHNEDDHNNDEHEHLGTAIQSMDSSSSKLNQSKEDEFGQYLIRTSLDFSIFTQTECNVPLQESDEALKICHQMDTSTTDHKSSIDTTTPFNENREEGQDVQMSLNNLIHNDKPSMVEQNVLKTMDDQSSLNYRREDVDTLDSCSAEEKNEVTEVQSVAFIDGHEHVTQDDKVARDIWPNVSTKASTEDENKDEDHLKKNDDSLNITKESSYKSKSRELREDTDEYKEVSVSEDRNDNDSNKGVATTNLNQVLEPGRNISSPLKLEDQEVGRLSDQFLSNELKFQAETEIKYYREEQYNVSEANTTSESSADMVDIHCGEKKKYKQTELEKEVENEDVQSTTSNQLFSKVSSTNMSDFITESELISAERLYVETETSFQTHTLDHNNTGEFPIELESKKRVCSGQMFDNEIKGESLLLNIETEVIKEKNNDINTDATESFTNEDFIRVDDEKGGISTFRNRHEIISVIANRQDYAFTDQAPMKVKEHGLESPDKGSASTVQAYARNEPVEHVPETPFKSDIQTYNAIVLPDQKQNMSEECSVNATNKESDAHPFENTFSTLTNESRMGQNDAVVENVRLSHFEKKEIDSTLSSLSGLISDNFKAIDETISVQSLEEITLISEDATLSFPSETCHHQSSVSMNILEPEKIHENMVNQDENVNKDVAKNENTNTLQEYIETPLHVTTDVVNTDQERNICDRQDEVTVMIKNICRGVDTTYVLSDVDEHLVNTEVLKMQRGTDVAESIVQNEEAESLDNPHPNNFSNFKLGQSNPSECTDIGTFTVNTDNLMAEPLDAAEDQINTVVLDEVSSVEGLTELLEQNEQPIVNEEKEAESTHLNEQEIRPIITKIQNDDFTEHVSLAVKMQGNESPDDEHASEVNAYTIHGPVELSPQTHTMSDTHMNTENIQIVGSDQNQNKSEEHPENFTKRESDLEPCQRTSAQQYLLCEVSSINTDLGSSTIEKPSPAREHPDFKEVDKNGTENQGNTDVEMSTQTKKRRKVGSTRRLQGRHQQTEEWKEEWKDLEHTEEIVHQIITQAATSILLTEPQNTISEVSSIYDIHDSPMTIEQNEIIKSEVQSETKVIDTPPAILSPESDQINTVVSHEGSSVEGLSDVKEQNEKPGVSVKENAESTLLNEQEMAPIITNITTINLPTSAVENPDFKEDNVNITENLEKKNTEIHKQTQTKKKKKYGSTRRPHERKQPQTEGEDEEWKDPENTEENEHQIITQAISSNLLTEPQNTISEMSVDSNDSNLTIEQKNIIKSDTEIRTGENDTSPAILSPEADQINTVISDDISSVEGLTNEQNEKLGVNEEKDSVSTIANMQEMTPFITQVHDDAFAAVKEHVSESADDEHVSEVKAYTPNGQVELIPHTHSMSDKQVNTENIHVIVSDQNQNISEEHLENLTNRESEPVEYESTSPFVQIQELKSSQADEIKENVEFSSSEKRRKMGSTRKSLRGQIPGSDQKSNLQAITEKENIQKQNMEQKDTHTGDTEEDNNDTKEKVNVGLTENVIKEGITPVSAQQDVLCEVSSLTTDLGFTTIKHPSSAGENPDFKEDNVNTTENVGNENAEIHIQTQTKKNKKFGSTRRPHGRQELHAEGEIEGFKDPENTEEIEHHIITQADTSNLLTESQNISEVSCDIHDSTLTTEQKETIETESEIGTGVINTPPAILLPEAEVINTVFLNEGSSVSGVNVKEEAESTLLNEQEMLPIITTIKDHAFTEHVSLPVKLHDNERADDESASEVRTSSTSCPVNLIPQIHSMSDMQINTEYIHAFVSDQNQNISEEHLDNSTNKESEPEQCDQKNKCEEIKEKEIMWERNMDQKDANIGVIEEKSNDTKEKINTRLTENIFKEDITPVSAQQNVLREVSSLTTDLGSTTIEHPSSKGENPDFSGDKANTTENVENKNAEDHMQTQTQKKKKFGSTRRPHGRQQPQAEGGEWKDPENTEEIKHQIISQSASSNLLTESQDTISEVLLDIHDVPLTMEQKETIQSEVEIWTVVKGTPPAILSPETDQMNIVVLDQRSSVEGLTDVKEQNEKPGISVKDDAESTLLKEQEMAPIITKIHDDGFAAVNEHGKQSTDASEVSLCTTCSPVELSVVTDEGSSIEGLSENKEYNEKTGVNEVKDAESTLSSEHEMAQVITKIHDDAFTEHVSLPVKKHGNEGPEDEHAREVNVYATCDPVEIIFQAHTMSDMQINTENIHAVVSDQNQNIPKEHLENLTNREPEPEQYESTSPFVQIQELKSSQVDEIKENVELFSSEKKRKIGSTRKSLRGQIPGSDQINKFQARKEIEKLHEQNMDQKDTNTGFTEEANNTKEGTNACLTENVGKEDITSVCAQQYVLCEVYSLSTDLASTTIEHPVEHPECKEDDGNSIENVNNTSAEIYMEAHTKKNKKFGSTQRPQRRQQPHAEGEEGEWKDPENTEETEQQIITQADTSNPLTDPHNTTSETTPMITELHDDAFAAVKEHVSESVDDEHASEVNAYTTCVPVELIPQTHTMSDLQMNTENIHVIVSDQNLNISEEHLENPTNRESEPEQYESTSPFVQIQEPKSSQVDVIKENVEFSSSEKKRKMGSTRRSLRGPAIDQKSKFQEINEKENLQEQNMEQKDTNTGVTQEDNNDTKEKINADLTENVIKEDITPVSAEQNALCEASSLTTVLGFTTIEHPSSARENPDFKEDNVNTTENVGNENAEIHTQTQTKKKKKFGSTRRPHGRQQPHAEGEDSEWKDPENTETEHQVIIQAATSNLLTESQNTTSEVSVAIHDSNLTMEPKETIKSEVDIGIGKTDTQPAILSPEADQINTVVLDDVSSVEGLTNVKEQNEKPGDDEDEHAESTLLNEQEITPMITELHDNAFAAVKEHIIKSVDDEHASEVNAYTTCVPVEFIPQTHTMSDLQMNADNIHVIVSDQNLNISEEHLENPINRESEPEQYESTSPFVQIQEPKSSQVDVIKENVDFSSSEKKRKIGSTRRSLRGPAIDQKSKFQEIKEIENLQEQNMEQKDTNTGVTQEDNNATKKERNYCLIENVIKEDITPVSVQPDVLCEVSSLTTDLGFTTIGHPSSAGENPDFEEDNVNTTENVENENTEMHMQMQTKKKKKFGSTRRPHGRQTLHAEGEKGEWKDPEENEHQMITQADTSNLLTDPHNTTSEVSLDIHDSNLTMEPKETIKSEVEIGTGKTDTQPAILSPEADQINTVVLDDISSVEGLTDVKEQNEKPKDMEDEHAESTLLNEQEITQMITELHDDAFAAVKEQVTDSHNDEHASEVNAYTTCVPVQLVPQTCTMSELQMNTENIHVIVSDQNLNISEEHLENPTNRELEPEQYESTSPFVQIQEPKSSQVDVIKENVEFSSSEKKRKMGSTRRSLRGPAIDQKSKFQEINEKENLQEQNMEQKDTNTGVTQEDNNDTKEKINADLTENVIKEDITPVSAEQNALCEASSLTTVLGFTTIEHPSSARENPDLKEDNVNTIENVENINAEIHTQTQTKKKKKFGSTRRPQRRQQPHAEGEDSEWKDLENAEEIEHHIITQAATSNLLTESQNTINEVSLDIHNSPLTVEQNETIKSEVEIGTGVINTPPAILSPDADQINIVVLENLTNRESESEQNESTSPFVQILESKSSHVDVIKANVEFSGSEKRRKMGSTRKSLRGQITGSDQKNKFQKIEEKEIIQEQDMDQKHTNTENTKEENNDKKEETNAGLTKNVLEEDFPSVNAQQYVLCEVPSLTTDLGLTTIKHPSSATEHPEFTEVDENSIDYVKNEKAEIQTQIRAKKKKKFGSTRRAQGRLQPHGTEGKLNDMEDTEEMHSDLNFCDTKTRQQEYEPPIHNTQDQSECSLLSEIELYLNKSFESTLNTSGLNPNISEFSDPMSDGSLQLPSSQSSQIHTEQTSPSRRRKMGSSRKMTRNRHAEKVCDESRGSEQEKENLDNNNAKYSEPKSEEKTVKETVISEGIEDIKQSVELMPEVQALSQLNESSTQATEPLPEVRRKFGSRRKVKGSSHLGAFTNGDNENNTEVTKDKLRVSDPFYMSEPESTQIAHPDSELRSGIEEVKEAVGKDTNASTEAGLVSLHTIRKTSPGVVSTGGRPKIDFNQWNEQIPDFEQAVYNIVMVGNSNVGKTSFIKHLQNGHFIPDYSATIGVDTFVQTVTFGSRTVKLYVWDTAGQERYHSITKQVFHKAQGLLLMYDITSSQSFQAVRAWISQVQENTPSDVILMLLGNKNDRTDREVQLKEGEDLSNEYDIEFMECSAATGENVLESLKTLAWLLVKQRVRKEEEHTTLQPKPQNKKKSGCC